MEITTYIVCESNFRGSKALPCPQTLLMTHNKSGIAHSKRQHQSPTSNVPLQHMDDGFGVAT